MSSVQIDVYNKLKNLIVYGELSPGEKLSELELSKKLQSSRTPIREAFRQLQMEGYIDVFPNKGAYVTKLPVEKIAEIYDVVALLEGRAVELATTKLTRTHMRELRMLQKKLYECASQKKYNNYAIINTEFHNLIIRLSGNNTLIKINDSLRMQLYRYKVISTMIQGQIPTSLSDHERILDAISKKNAVAAGKLFREHVMRVKEILVAFLKHDLIKDVTSSTMDIL